MGGGLGLTSMCVVRGDALGLQARDILPPARNHKIESPGAPGLAGVGPEGKDDEEGARRLRGGGTPQKQTRALDELRWHATRPDLLQHRFFRARSTIQDRKKSTSSIPGAGLSLFCMGLPGSSSSPRLGPP